MLRLQTSLVRLENSRPKWVSGNTALDEYKTVLRLDFLDKAHALLASYMNALLLFKPSNVVNLQCMKKVSQQTITAMQLKTNPRGEDERGKMQRVHC